MGTVITVFLGVLAVVVFALRDGLKKAPWIPFVVIVLFGVFLGGTGLGAIAHDAANEIASVTDKNGATSP